MSTKHDGISSQYFYLSFTLEHSFELLHFIACTIKIVLNLAHRTTAVPECSPDPQSAASVAAL